MILSIAWKNIWRNKTRSFVVITAIALGLFAGVYATAFMVGVSNQKVKQAIGTEVSHIQVHQPGYLENYDAKLFLTEAEQVLQKIEEDQRVVAASKRTIITPLISTAHAQQGGIVVGVKPEQEQKVTNITDFIDTGHYFTSGSNSTMLIGKTMAEKLNVDVGNKVIITVNNLDTVQISERYDICGIFNTGNDMFDGQFLFVKKDYLDKQLDMPENSAHEIAVLLHNTDETGSVTQSLSELLDPLEVLSFKQISPELSMLIDTMDQYMMIFIIIILAALCFGIINTMLMVILERVKELGMLKAVGMNQWMIFRMVVMESVLLSLTGGIVGIIFGYIVVRLSAINGIPLDAFGEGLEGMGYATLVFPEITFPQLINIAVLVIFTGIISAIYPALRAIRLNPAEALRTL